MSRVDHSSAPPGSCSTSSCDRSGGRFIFPMYHPAAALHQSSLRETLFTDMRGLPAALLAAREALEAERVSSVLRANPEPAPVEPATSVDEAEQLPLF